MLLHDFAVLIFRALLSLLTTAFMAYAAHGSQLLHVCQALLGAIVALSRRTQVPSSCFFQILLHTNSNLFYNEMEHNVRTHRSMSKRT